MPFAIGVEHIKTEANVGTLFRSAYNFGASLLFTVGRRYKRQSSDTVAAFKHIPMLHFLTWDEARHHWPLDWIPIAIEICPEARSLVSFVHPKAAVYILGPEDGSISDKILQTVKTKISIPTNRCLNVATAGAIVMYDRIAKELRA